MKKSLIILLVIAVIGGLIALALNLRTPTTPPPDPAVAAAEMEAEQGRLMLALENERDVAVLLPRLRELVQKYPDYAAAHTTLGQTLLQLGRLDEAGTALDRSLALNPNQPEVASLAAGIAAQQGRVDDAIENYQTAIAADADDPRFRFQLGNLYLREGRLEEAEAALQAALARDAEMHQAHAALADVDRKRHDFNAADTRLQRAIELATAPKPTPSGGGSGTDNSERDVLIYQRKRAAVLREAGRPDEALAVLRDLPRRVCLSPGVRDDLAELYNEVGQPVFAALNYERATIIDPLDADAAEQAVRWYLKADEPDDAAAALAKLQRIQPHHPALQELQTAVTAARK